MITYIINFILCSGLLLAVYRIVLRNENLYRFNRFYLLGSLAFSLVVPLVTIHFPNKEVDVTQQQLVIQNLPEQVSPSATLVPGKVINNVALQTALPAPKPANNYLPGILLAIYLIGAVFMLVRFIKNLVYISRSVSKGTILQLDGAKLILVDGDTTPHSFLKYIFINKADYNNGLIEPEIICHEQTHINQLHSLDVILIELFNAICWFNPLIPFYRKAIQLNHEFLADETVIKTYDNTPAYQYLVLTKYSRYSGLYVTSQFNYLSTKTRLLMMTRESSVVTEWLARLAVIPVVTIAFLIFCNKAIAAPKPALTNQQTEPVKFPVPHDTTFYTAAHLATLSKQVKDIITYQQSDDAKHKRKMAEAIWGKTIHVKITGSFKDKNDNVIGILAKDNNDEYLVETSYGQEKQLNNLLKAGDEVTVNVYGTSFYYAKDRPVGIVPAYVMKADKKVFQLAGVAQADKIPGYPFISEANKVYFPQGRIVNFVKKENGKWWTAQFETVNDYTGYSGYAFHDNRFLGNIHIGKKIKNQHRLSRPAEKTVGQRSVAVG